MAARVSRSKVRRNPGGSALIEQSQPKRASVRTDLNRGGAGGRPRDQGRGRKAGRRANRLDTAGIKRIAAPPEPAQRALAYRRSARAQPDRGARRADREHAARQSGIDPLGLQLDTGVDVLAPLGAIVARALHRGEDRDQSKRKQPERQDEEHLSRGREPREPGHEPALIVLGHAFPNVCRSAFIQAFQANRADRAECLR